MPNRLKDSLSPYLEQHADNPVDWRPWGPEALEAARTSDRPIVLSIGYSACHWCHVMAHESFEDETIAKRMNAWFVNIKVDREERPDLDRIYQLAHQLLTGRGGGWPLTVFLDPTDLSAFVAGTYFPPRARHGLIGFSDLLERVHDAWLNRREDLKAQNRQLSEALQMITTRRGSPDPEAGDPAATLLGQLDARFDRRHGGFGGAPKFPQAPLLDWLASTAGGGTEDEGAAQMLGDTLDAMAQNGLYDHLGGGFYRYCVDAAWEIPHFEKMLADNAQLLPLYAEAAARWGNRDWANVAELTAEFLARDLGLDEGGLATSLDADSLPAEPEETGDSGAPAMAHEGEHYLWTPDQFEDCLDADALQPARARFGLDGPPNFPPGDKPERWHLVLARSLGELTDAGHDAEVVAETVERARRKLLDCRRRRPFPGRDDKILAGLNALAAAGLARAGRLLGHDDWIGRGEKIADLVWERLFAARLREDLEPHAVWRDGRSDHPSLLDDHAALLFAATELLQGRWTADWLERAGILADRIRDRFFDADTQTLFLTPHGHEPLPVRPTANTDDAIPAGAGLAARGLARLGHLTGKPEWLDLASAVIEGAAGDIQQAPIAHASLLLARDEIENPPPQVLIGGDDAESRRWHARLRARAGLHSYLVTDADPKLPGPLARIGGADRATAVVCVGAQCLAPVNELDELERQLEHHSA